MKPPFLIATVQSRITSDIRENGRHIRSLMEQAKAGGAHLIHFSEGALSGYVKSQIWDWSAIDWSTLRAELEAIAVHAGQLGIWTVLGCCHRLTPPHLPHNSLYVISDEGRLVGRYDKRLCSAGETYGNWYTPGTEPVVFTAGGYRFGCLICIEVHFPHLFAEYERADVDCVLFSAYSDNAMFGIELQGHAAINSLWVSLSTPSQCGNGLPAGLIGPDGIYRGRLSPSADPGISFGTLDREDLRLDVALNKARPWRRISMSGEAYRDHLVEDERSNDRTLF